jgi:alkylation response protein AidB-like acyl-CoA dehydrogenase
VTTFDSITASLRDLAQTLPSRAEEIAAARRLPQDLVEALKSAGAFRIAVPHALGGPELSFRQQTEIVEMLAYYEPSVAWCVMIGSDAPYYGAFMDADVAAELWPSIDDVTAGLVQPAGQAKRVDGGYNISGKWAFGSGCTHADVIVGGCLVVDDAGVPVFGDDGAPDWVVATAPAHEWTILDTWHTIGLAGSGSNDYTATNLFVPEHRCFRFSGSIHRTEPLFQFRMGFVTNMAGVPLGMARRSIDIVAAIAADKLVLPEFVMMRDLPRVRNAVARAEAEFGGARAYLYDSLDRLWDTLVRGDQPSAEIRAAVALSRVHAFQKARDITQLMCETAGASSIYTSSPLERLQRDAMTVVQHVVAQPRIYEMAGELVLTGASSNPLI